MMSDLSNLLDLAQELYFEVYHLAITCIDSFPS